MIADWHPELQRIVAEIGSEIDFLVFRQDLNARYNPGRPAT